MIEEDVSKIQTKSNLDTLYPTYSMTLSCRIFFSFSVHDLEILFKKRLLVNFESDESEQEREIELKTNEITSIFKHAVYMTSTCYTKKGIFVHENNDDIVPKINNDNIYIPGKET